MKIVNIDVGQDESGRLDAYLAKKISELSRSQVKKLIEDGSILVNGEKIKSSYKIEYKDSIRVEIPEEKEIEILPENIELDIIYEDDDICLVNKAQDMVVHPATGNYSGTLVNALMYHIDTLSDLNGEIRPGIVHRLDKDTSGLLVVAKNNKSHEILADNFKKRDIKRKYQALVYGVVQKDKGIIEGPIGRHPVNRQRMAVVEENSKEAKTYYKVLERFNNYSLVELQLETGRTHQLRVHMEYINHPIVGDPIYTRRKNPFKLDKQALHAKKLGFSHPTTKEYMEFEIDLPEYLEKIIRNLRHRRL